MTIQGPFNVLETKQVYKNKWIEVREDAVIRPDGEPGIFGVVTMVPGASILPVDNEGYVYLVEEFKYGIGRNSLEVISGAIDANEQPIMCAHRELAEETGFTAGEMIPLGAIDPFTTVINSPNHLFLARKLTQGISNPDAGEILRVVKVRLEDALEQVMEGKITHGASCVIILKACFYLGMQISQQKNSL